MKYHFKIYKEKAGGYWAECIELPGCITEANSKGKLEKKMKEALNLFLSEPPESRLIFQPPDARLEGRNIVGVEVESSVAIANRIRELRLRRNLTQMAMKNRLGIRHLSNYQRLEDPRRANPEWSTLANIKKHFPEFQLDDLI